MRTYEIMTPQVITVDAEARIVDAARLMLEHHISGLPVVDAAGYLIGIVSEGDFLRRAETGTEHRRGRWLTHFVGADRVAAEFVHEQGRKVGEIMTPNPLTATEEMPLQDVVGLMESGNVKRLPVVRNGKPVGIITRSDFLSAIAVMADAAKDASTGDAEIRGAVENALRNVSWRPSRFSVTVRNGVVSLRGIVRKDSARKAAVVAAENVPGVRRVLDHLSSYPPPEEDLGGGDFVSLQEQPSTADDEPL